MTRRGKGTGGPVIGGRAHTIEQVRDVCSLGYPFAEIDVCDLDQIARDLKELTQIREQYGVYYLAHYPNEGNPVDTEVLREHFVPRMKGLLKASHDLGITKGTLHFWMDRRWAPPSLISAKTDLLSDMLEEACRRGIVLCIENLTERYDSFSPVFEALPDLRMTLDIGHGELLSRENTSFRFIEHVFHKIDHVHAHDNRGGKTVADDLHLPLGDGKVDYAGILARLREKGYASTISMEVNPLDMPRTKIAIEEHVY